MNKPHVSAYLPSLSLHAYLRLMQQKFPQFYNTFQFHGNGAASVIRKMVKTATDFEGSEKGGRGDYYQKAQTDPSVRSMGITQLLQLATHEQELNRLPDSYKILDVLGGDGVLARVLSRIQNTGRPKPFILTSDIAGAMVHKALQYNLPAIRQPAQHLFLKDNSYDAVIVAYGTHHIPKTDRLTVCREAWRVLKPSGTIVIHDFENKSPIAQWFLRVVDKYSMTGHSCDHFSVSELRWYLKQCGFRHVKVFSMYDPFIVSGPREQRVFAKLMDYVLYMYGLKKLIQESRNQTIARQTVYRLIKTYIHYDYGRFMAAKPYWKQTISFYKKDGLFVGEIPRVALVAIGQKAV